MKTSCGTPNTLQEVLVDEAIADGLQDSVSAEVCYPAGGPKGDVGEPVRVTMETPFTFVPLLNIGTITLRAHATMRLEQEPTLISNEVDPCS